MASSGLRVVRERALTRITIDRAERLNSLATPDLLELAAVIDESDDGATKVVVLTGAGRAFCSGADLSEGVDASTVSAAQTLVETIVRVRPVVVAAINGPAAGVGASIALACDLTLAARSALLLTPFLRLGLVPDGGATYSLVARAGAARAARMALGGERVMASEAAAWGLLGEVVEDGELEARVDEVVSGLLEAPVDAIFATKALLRGADSAGLRAAGLAELDSQTRLLATPEFARARSGFLSKSPASFRDQ